MLIFLTRFRYSFYLAMCGEITINVMLYAEIWKLIYKIESCDKKNWLMLYDQYLKK